MPILATRRCLKGWPWHYVTTFQETEYPYRHADRAHVLRLGPVGIVFGRTTRRIQDPDEAVRVALGARDIQPDEDFDDWPGYASIRRGER